MENPKVLAFLFMLPALSILIVFLAYPMGLGVWLAELRQSITDRILTQLPGETGAVAAALMTGYQTAVPEPVMAAMRDSGLAHLLSISGLHIGLVAGLLFVGLRRALALIPPLALAHPIKKWAAGAALIGAFGYLLLSGAPVPTQRAFLMTGLMLVAVLLDRRAISMRSVAWAACAILLITPEALVGASLQMSFAAVVALVAAYEGTRDYRMRQRIGSGPLRRAGLYVAGIALTSVVATLATAPYSVFHFNRLALYGVVANVLAVPLTGLWVMPWAVAAFLLMPFGLEGLVANPLHERRRAHERPPPSCAMACHPFPGAAPMSLSEGFVSSSAPRPCFEVTMRRRAARFTALAAVLGAVAGVAACSDATVMPDEAVAASWIFYRVVESRFLKLPPEINWICASNRPRDGSPSRLSATVGQG